MNWQARSCLMTALLLTMVPACLSSDDGGGGGYVGSDAAARDASRGTGGPVSGSDGGATVTPDAGGVDDATTFPDEGTPDAGTFDEGTPVFDTGPSVDAFPDDDAFDPGDTASASCGSVTIEGECDGNLLRYCDENGQLQEYDCTSVFPPEAATGSCAFVASEWGYDCVVQIGDSCLYEDENGDPFPAFCAGSGSGCVLTADTATCQAGLGTCSPDDTAPCRGDQLMLGCAVNQPVVIDCPSYGASCSELDEACVGLPLGADCDSLLQCDTGLQCLGGTDTTPGTCQ